MSQPLLRWIVAEERIVLGAVVDRIGEPGKRALAEGRLFVDGARMSDAALELGAGSRVEIFAARVELEGAHILAEHEQFVVAYKPPLLATEPDRAGAAVTLLSEASRLLGCKTSDLHAVSRLDVGVSGAVVLSRAAAGPKSVPPSHHRSYVGIVRACPAPDAGTWTSPIERRGRGVQSAETRYAVVAQSRARGLRSSERERAPLSPALLALEPVTGRFHQLRIHASRAEAALFGDRSYGGVTRLVGEDGSLREIGRIALHASAVRITLARGGALQVEAPVPADLRELWRALGGVDSDWDEEPKNRPSARQTGL
jgi:23S rRNA-/tRNA-specific pseudouridylate synthase